MEELEKDQEKREFLRAIGPVATGLGFAVLATITWFAVDPGPLIAADAVIQVIPVLLIAVILEGGVVAFPRLTRRPRKFIYGLLFGIFVLLLLGAIGAAIIDWPCEPSAPEAVQLAAVSAGSVTVASGFLFHSLGSLFPLEITVVKKDAVNSMRERNSVRVGNVLKGSGCEEGVGSIRWRSGGSFGIGGRLVSRRARSRGLWIAHRARSTPSWSGMVVLPREFVAAG